MKLDSYRERVGDYGNMTGQGALELLGASELNPLEIVVREAVQNSWDAMIAGENSAGSGVDFWIDAWTLKEAQSDALRTALSDEKLEHFAKRHEFDCLVLSDRRTTGLDGSVRPPAQSNFTRFAYLIGQTKPDFDEASPGGTYGFGRSAFLNASQVNTVLVHTRCLVAGKYESRLIVMAWRPEGENETGRIWWGWKDEGWVGPLRGAAADQLARAVGLSVPEEKETGTSIAILAPRWRSDGDDESLPNVAAERLASLEIVKRAITWNCWPRMVSTPTIAFRLHWFGAAVQLVDPRSDPQLSRFVRALALVDGSAPLAPLERVEEGVHGTKKVTLGRTGLVLSPALPLGGSPMPRDIGDSLRHVALMRGNRLVVKYLPVATALPPRFQLAGAFLANPKQDRVFADSEPPTHDDWRPNKLPKDRSTIIRVALTRIKELADTLAFPSRPGGSTPGLPLAEMGNALGSLVLGAEGGGPTPLDDVRFPRPPKPGVKGPKKAHVGIEVGPPEYGRTRADRQEVVVPFTVRPGAATTHLSARLTVAVEGGEDAEKSAARGSILPEVTAWTVDGRAVKPDSKGVVVLEGKQPREVRLSMTQPHDCVVDLALVDVSGGA